jgi:catechol 2,3-dioxygenase-like lactoylglutathione lyase family enzyme
MTLEDIIMFGQNAIHANFSVDDLSAAKDFYCNKLGFKLIGENSGQMLLQAGGNTKIVIYEKADHAAWDSTVLGIEVADVGEAVEQLKGQGISVEKVEGTDENGIASHPELGEAAWFKDVAGNWLCINHLAV